jgi:hypothetical protein
MRFEEYRRCDAVALAGLVHKGEVSASELLLQVALIDRNFKGLHNY